MRLAGAQHLKGLSQTVGQFNMACGNRSLVLVLFGVLASPLSGLGQRVDASPALGVGWQNASFTVEAGGRLDVTVHGIGGYVRSAVRGFSRACETCLPAYCDY